MGIDGIRVVIIAFGQIEEALLVSSQCAYGFGITVALGFTEGKLAEVPSGGVVGSSIGIIAEEV